MYHYNYKLLRSALGLAMFGLMFFADISGALAQTKIGGTATPGDPSSVLELQSTSQGFLPPRMTTAQRDAINSPATGLTIYNTTTNCIQVYRGAGNGWQDLCDGPGALTFTNCSSPVVTGTFEATKTTTATIQLNYTNTTGKTLGAFLSSTVNGITLSAPGGSVTAITAGSGSITLTASGTPASAGNTTIPIVLAGAGCDIPITVIPFQGNIPVACGTAPGCTGGVSSTAAVDGDKVCWGGFEYKVISTGGRLWFDRNLGARQAATSATDALAYGDYYQWGRLPDGHQCATSTVSTTRLTSYQQSNGGQFIVVAGSPYDWMNPVIAANTPLWDGTATGGINNPCPPGWRVPTSTELPNIPATMTAPLNFPFNGQRYGWQAGAPFANVGTRADLWTSTNTTASTGFAKWGGSSTGTGNTNVVNGLGVRCIKHQ